jgi:addiction module HigA family antidote
MRKAVKPARAAAMQPVNPFHPGEILLEEFLVPSGTSQAAFARRVGWTTTRLNEFIKGKRGVTADAAIDLAECLGTSARLWMNLQATFDLAAAMRCRHDVA